MKSSRNPVAGVMVLLALLLALLLPTRSYRHWVEFGPQQQVITLNPKMGVHTRLTDEVEPWKIQRTLEMVREMGAPWIVEYFLWAAHEPQRGVYDWGHADLVVDHAVNQGLTVIARLGYVPEWARPPRTAISTWTRPATTISPALPRRSSRTFGPGEATIIVWNEPNLSQEWGFRPVDPAAYTELLCRAYPASQGRRPRRRRSWRARWRPPWRRPAASGA